MRLTQHGTIKSDDYNLNFTQGGKWLVSRNGTFIGEADTLAEVPALIERAREAVRERLAKVEAEAAARYTERSMREGEGANVDPNKSDAEELSQIEIDARIERWHADQTPPVTG